MTSETRKWTRENGFAEPERDVTYNADKRFDITLPYGSKGERLIGSLLDLYNRGDKTIEVKRKSREDGKFYVELQNSPGHRGFQPSGLATTEADVWAFVLGGTGVFLFVTPRQLRTAIERNYGFPAEERRGSCPTKGRLLDFFDILSAIHDKPASRAQFGDEFRWPV
jgi:hypothetical protein